MRISNARMQKTVTCPFSIKLPKHPDQVGTCDPRIVWIYDCEIGPYKVDCRLGALFGNYGEFTYLFLNETDFLMFKLRWA